MSTTTMERLGDIDPRSLGRARSLVHNVAQWLARLSHSYLPHRQDLSHLDLNFEADRAALATSELERDISVELRLADLVMQFREAGARVSHEINLEERSPAQVEAWLLVEMLHRAMDREKFSKDLPYEIKDFLTGDAKDYDPENCAGELRELSRWFVFAARSLDKLRSKHDAAAPIVCRPQTLQMLTILPLSADRTAGAAALQLGFSPGTERQPEPHFFAMVAASKPSSPVPIGKILTATALIAERDRDGALRRFFAEAVAQARAHAAT